jgi:uncharacterized protein (TIGR00369 family)
VLPQKVKRRRVLEGGQVRDPAITLDELTAKLAAEFPEAFHADSSLSIMRIGYRVAHLRYAFRAASLRPGGTISGGVMMLLADATMYVAVLASIGWVPLAVTTNLSINFLKKPGPTALDAECRLLKLGKRLAVGEIAIRSQGDEELAAHATSTYFHSV